MAVVIHPATYFLIELTNQPYRRCADATLDLLANPVQKGLDTALAGLDQQLAPVLTEVEAQKIEAFVD